MTVTGENINFLHREVKKFFTNKYVLEILKAAVLVVALMVGFLCSGWTITPGTMRQPPAPDLTGMDATTAVRLLESSGFKWTIIDSSRYEPSRPPRAVLSQDPEAGVQIKQGRKVYIKINRSSWEDAAVPAVDFENDKVDNVSKRLAAAGFRVGEVIYQPHIGRDVVLGLSSSGMEIHPGQKLPKTTVINIIAGQGEDTGIDEDTTFDEEDF